ncbi:hypothetical protein AHF37_10348 [Paragonimus kellicotti]|nr:hypothetical protein AHF37_10348 [Paragonimus kellicotti]
MRTHPICTMNEISTGFNLFCVHVVVICQTSMKGTGFPGFQNRAKRSGT